MRATIKPIKFHLRTANTLEVRGCSLGPPPTFYYAFLSVTPEVPAVPAVTDADANTITPEVPAIPERVETVADGNVTMTAEQWAAWGEAVDDAAYQLACVAALVEAELA